VLATWPFEDEVVVRRFYNRLGLLFNMPEEIRRVLVDNGAVAAPPRDPQQARPGGDASTSAISVADL
jgi:hypothetical protein